jgi:hypothetical protein
VSAASASWLGAAARTARLNQSRAADAIWQPLPIEGRAGRWGDEICFPIPLELASDVFGRIEQGAPDFGRVGSGERVIVEAEPC